MLRGNNLDQSGFATARLDRITAGKMWAAPGTQAAHGLWGNSMNEGGAGILPARAAPSWEWEGRDHSAKSPRFVARRDAFPYLSFRSCPPHCGR
jgi:hypothetical protein